jgi:CRP/FNR family transcriptional regulator, cyclic AMP receptor protein
MAFKRKTKDAKIALLSRVELFSACRRSDLARIASLVDEVEAREGRVLTREGERGREAFVVAAGRGKASIGGRKVATLERGAIFGEMSLLDQGPRSATITAETDMQLLVMDSRSFSSLIEDVPTVGHKVLKTMAERLRAAEKSAPTH